MTRKREEGAVMFLVMMVIMMASATATFAVHTAVIEMRGRGFMRQSMQTGYLAESTMMAALDWVDWLGPAKVREQLDTAGIRFDGNFPEVDLAPERYAYRIYADSIALMVSATPPIMVNAPIDTGSENSSFGPRNIYTPQPFADIYDIYEWSRPIPGMPADSPASYKYLRATITARGRAGIPNDVWTPGDPREYNEAARDVRAYIRMGPFM